MIPDSNGEVKAELDASLLTSYSHLYIISKINEGVTHTLSALPSPMIEKRDLIHHDVLDTNKAFSVIRTTNCILKGESYIFEDNVSAETKIIDDIEKVMEVHKVISNEDIKELTSFIDLKNWNTMGDLKKESYYSQNYCHKLNLFIYKKSPEFFKLIVKPFFQYHMDNTFLDYYLLAYSHELITSFRSPLLHHGFNFS